VTRTVFHYAWGSPVQISIRAGEGVPALFAPRRSVLDRILVDAAVDAGAEVRHGVTVTSVLTDPRGRVVGVRATDAAHRTFTAQARSTIGADGIRSTVATAVGAVVQRQSTSGSATLYAYFEGLPAEGYEWAYGTGAAAGLLPTNDGQTCVFVGASRERLRWERRAGADAAFAELFRVAAPRLQHRLSDATRVSRLHGWSGQVGHVRHSHGPGWALVGDAGYFRDPITTHGMTDALRDAELLADALLASWAGDQLEAVALARYQAKRDALSRQLFEVSDRIAGFDWDPKEIHQLLREVSSAMSDEVSLLQSLPTRPDRRIPADVGTLALADPRAVGG
jgi:2-polyprenyl-6-methoxyphenol hydroxylase-like FAD-dependent oxidoreductase